MIIGMSQEKLGENEPHLPANPEIREGHEPHRSKQAICSFSKILEVPVGYFFEDAFASSAAAHPAHGLHQPAQEGVSLDFLNSREGLDLNRAFAESSMRKPRARTLSISLGPCRREA